MPVNPKSLANLKPGKAKTKAKRCNFYLSQDVVDWLELQPHKTRAIEMLVREEKMLSIGFKPTDCNIKAQKLLEYVDSTYSGEICHVDIYSREQDFVLGIWAQSTISERDRIRKYGLPDVNFTASELIRFKCVSLGMFVPDDQWIDLYLLDIEKMTSKKVEEKRHWEIPFELVRAISSGQLIGYKAWNSISNEFWDWCDDGHFTPTA